MNKKRGILYAVLGSVFWGCSGTIAEYLFSNYAISALWLVGIRLILSGVLLLIWYSFSKNGSIFTIWKNKKSSLLLIYFAFLGMLPSQLTYFMAIRYGNAPTATVLQFLGPIFIILYLSLSNKVLPQRVDTLSVLIALIGTFLLVTSGSFSSLSLSSVGLIWGICAGISQASYTLLPRNLLSQFDSRLVVGWAMLLSGIPLFPFTIQTHLPILSPVLFINIGFIIIFGTMLAYLFYLNSLRDIEPSTTGMLSSFEPLTATILSIVFLNTNLSPVQIIGGILVISTIFIQYSFKKR